MDLRKVGIFLSFSSLLFKKDKKKPNSYYKIKVKIDTIKISENTLNIVEVTRVTKVCFIHLMCNISKDIYA